MVKWPSMGRDVNDPKPPVDKRPPRPSRGENSGK